MNNLTNPDNFLADVNVHLGMITLWRFGVFFGKGSQNLLVTHLSKLEKDLSEGLLGIYTTSLLVLVQPPLLLFCFLVYESM